LPPLFDYALFAEVVRNTFEAGRFAFLLSTGAALRKSSAKYRLTGVC